MKNHLIALLLILIFLVSGCVQNLQEERICELNKCGGYNLSCVMISQPMNCLAVHAPGNVCRKFVSCEIVDGVCQTIKKPEYDDCVDCFMKCEDYDKISWNNCTSNCDGIYRNL
jgi:hypothetical protein